MDFAVGFGNPDPDLVGVVRAAGMHLIQYSAILIGEYFYKKSTKQNKKAYNEAKLCPI